MNSNQSSQSFDTHSCGHHANTNDIPSPMDINDDTEAGTGGDKETLKTHMDKQVVVANLQAQQDIRTIGSIFSDNFHFDQNVAIEQTTRWLVRFNRPLDELESYNSLVRLVKYLQPAFPKVPKKTVIRYIMRKYREVKQFLTACFDSSTCNFALTCDYWKAATDECYLCITSHWIDDDWNVQKRIIGFKGCEYPHSDNNIAELITSTTHQYKVLNRIFCISFDNTKNNDITISILKKCMNPILNGALFHNRCACYIFNSCLKDLYQEIYDIVSPIRYSILCIRSSLRTAEFKALCQEQGVSYKKFKLDYSDRWDSILDMLQSALPFQNQLIEYCSNNNFGINLDNTHFDSALVISTFLDSFKEATKLLSGSYYPTIHLIIPTISKVACVLQQYREHIRFGSMATAMIEKFKKYYEDIPLLYCLALCMDPRVKICGFECMIEQMYSFLDIHNADVERIKSTTTSTLSAMFDLYEEETSTNTGEGSSSSSISMPSRSSAASFNPYDILKGQRTASTLNEFDIYKIAPLVNHDESNFDILRWWKDHSKAYPILARMARDLLTLPASTMDWESAFSLSARKLDEEKSYLATRTLEALMCTRDWYNAEERMQGLMAEFEDEEEDWEIDGDE